jgi:hypothetical protein
MVQTGNDFLICDNIQLALPDDSVDEVITNNTPPADTVTWLGPSVHTAEIRRILIRGGRWIHNGVVQFVKP